MPLSRLTFSFCAVLVAACFLLSCGEANTAQPLTLTPSSVNITVDSMTGNQTGATAFTASRGSTSVDLSTLTWTTASSTVPPSCFGVDQSYVPHCNPGCGNSYSGTITANVTGTATATNTTGSGTGTTGTTITSQNNATVPITCTWQ